VEEVLHNRRVDSMPDNPKRVTVIEKAHKQAANAPEWEIYVNDQYAQTVYHGQFIPGTVSYYENKAS